MSDRHEGVLFLHPGEKLRVRGHPLFEQWVQQLVCAFMVDPQEPEDLGQIVRNFPGALCAVAIRRPRCGPAPPRAHA
ncbi:MAG TPA: hypothetical protein VMF65_09035 [Acidimicrobiales bacterium]|nr:hypothetical protein [Acidimicrobiales bacterium]